MYSQRICSCFTFLDDSFTKMYSFGRINPAKVLPAGFVYENLYDGVFAMFPESKCLIYKVNVTEKQYNNLVNEIRLFENNKDNLKYNILGTSLVYFNNLEKEKIIISALNLSLKY